MEIIDRANRAHLLSRQVSEARYFFLTLQQSTRGAVRPAFGGREQCNPDYRVQRRSFTFTALEFVAAGEGSVVLDGIRHPLRPGTAFAYGRTTACTIETTPGRPLQKYFVCLNGRAAAALLARSGVRPGTARAIPHGLRLVPVWDDLLEHAVAGGPHAAELAGAILRVLTLRIRAALTQPEAASGAARATFERIKAAIDAHPERLRSLADVAALVHLEPETICRVFKRYQGESPYQYLLRKKMTLAASVLLENGGLAKDAAARVGFADPLHFSRVFRTVLGVPPSRIRHDVRR